MPETTCYRKYILFFIFSWLVINFFPGSYNVDTWYQYHEFANKDYDDWHSPWMAYLWKILFAGTHKFFSLYLFQMFWYFVFYYYLLKLVNNKIVLLAGFASSIFFVFMAQYLMKDVHVALSWASALLILLYPLKKQPYSARYMALLFMIYGLYLRPNTLPALLPFLYIFVERYSAKEYTRLRKVIMSVVAALLIFASYFILTYPVLQTRRAYPEYKLKLMDVIGITKLSGQNYIPECITTSSLVAYDQKKILDLYSPATIDHIYWYWDGSLLLPLPTQELDDCLKLAWKKAILEHPFLYLKNRTEGFLYYLKIKKRVKPEEYWNVVVSVVKNNNICIDDEHSPFTIRMLGFWNKLDKIHFYDPWVWLLLNSFFFVLFVAKYIKQKMYAFKTLAALQLSAILFTLGMFPVFQIDRDFRYTYFNVFTIIIALIFWLGNTDVMEKMDTREIQNKE